MCSPAHKSAMGLPIVTLTSAAVKKKQKKTCDIHSYVRNRFAHCLMVKWTESGHMEEINRGAHTTLTTSAGGTKTHNDVSIRTDDTLCKRR